MLFIDTGMTTPTTSSSPSFIECCSFVTWIFLVSYNLSTKYEVELVIRYAYINYYQKSIYMSNDKLSGGKLVPFTYYSYF